MNVAEIKKWLRNNEPQSATKLAAMCEVSPGTIARILKGKATSLEVAKKISIAIGVSLDTLSEDRAS